MTKRPASLSAYSDQSLFNAFDKPRAGRQLTARKLAFIGNSLTVHGPAPAIGWNHDHGMAASSPDLDYVHQVLARLRVPAEVAGVGNFADFEREPVDADEILRRLQSAVGISATVAVVQLGDNASNQVELQAFADNLCRMIPILKERVQLILVLSTWWESPPKDQLLQKVCELFKIRYVPIGDIFKSPQNRDRSQKRFSHQGVDNHPGDWGMSQIAMRIQSAIEEEGLAITLSGS